MRHFLFAICAFCLVVCPAFARTWTSSDGKYTIEAELVSFDGATARLKRSNGSVVSVPVSRLSAADQEFLKTAKPATKPKAPASTELDKEAVEFLTDVGVRVVGSSLVLTEETRLRTGLRDITSLRKKMFLANKTLQGVMAQDARLKQQVAALRQLNVQLNARLANVNPDTTNVGAYNQLVSAVKANETQLASLADADKQMRDRIKTSRGGVNEAREAYVERILELRELADKLATNYSKLAADQDVQSAIGKLNAGGATFELAESSSYKSSVNKLKALEDTVLSESIDLRNQDDSLYVTAVIDGKHTKEMVIDSGATIMVLPQQTAKDCGIEPKSTDPTITLQLADGSLIRAKQVHIKSVRVGKFTVENVECAVLGPEAVAAEPVLGMSFLGQFKFEIDSQQNKLTMVKVDNAAKK